MAGRVDGKAVIVTGAGSGIGRAFAVGLASSDDSDDLTGQVVVTDGGMVPV